MTSRVSIGGAPMSDRLRDRVALVTGAASGIGLAVAERFGSEGAAVGLFDIDEAALHHAVNRLAASSVDTMAYHVDVADEAAVERAVGELTAQTGPLDVAVINAGIQMVGLDSRLGDLEVSVWEQTLRVNLTGAFVAAKHAIRSLVAAQAADSRPAGRSMIFTGSPTGLYGSARGFSAYSASKAGVHGLMRVAAADYAPLGVRVNAVIPGFTHTPLVSALEQDEGASSSLLTGIPLGRQGLVEDMTGLYVFLATDDSAYCTGAYFTSDGGATAV